MNEPTEPGFYWRIGKNYDGIHVEQIVKVEPMVSTTPSELFYWEFEELGGTYIKPDPNVNWVSVMDRDTQERLCSAVLNIAFALTTAGLLGLDGPLEDAVTKLIKERSSHVT